MKTKLFVTLAAIGLALLIPSGASAVCTTPITLSNTNVTGFGVTVTLCLEGNTLTVTGITNTSGLTVLGLDQLGYNTSATLVSTTNPTTGWSNQNCPASGCELDGFGKFVSEVDNSANLTGVGLSWTFSGTPGTDLAVHIRFSNSCSAFVSNRGPISGTTKPECGVVPEPGTMALFGSGLVAIAGIIRRRFAA